MDWGSPLKSLLSVLMRQFCIASQSVYVMCYTLLNTIVPHTMDTNVREVGMFFCGQYISEG